MCHGLKSPNVGVLPFGVAAVASHSIADTSMFNAAVVIL